MCELVSHFDFGASIADLLLASLFASHFALTPHVVAASLTTAVGSCRSASDLLNAQIAVAVHCFCCVSPLIDQSVAQPCLFISCFSSSHLAFRSLSHFESIHLLAVRSACLDR